MIFGRIAAARFLFLAAWGMAWLVALPAAAEEDAGYAMPSRAKITALLTALFYHQHDSALTGSHAVPATASVFASLSPDRASEKRERNGIVAFADSLVYEGGYYPQAICSLMGYDNRTTAKISRNVRQLDNAMRRSSSAWEVAGRVGRAADVRVSGEPLAMRGEGVGDALATPGTLAWLPVLAVAYAEYPGDGAEAAAQLSVLMDDDLRAGPVARAAFSLLRQALIAKRRDKDAWLCSAAVDSGELTSEQDLKAVRVKDWRYLRGEECAMGRMERAVYLWYKGDSYTRIMEEGGKFLQARESLDFLAALAGVTYGREGLPTGVISAAASDAKLLELVHDLHDLATSEAVLGVGAEDGEE